MNPLAGILLIVAISVGGFVVSDRLRFRRYWNRGCMGWAWLSAFPGASKSEIRDFLATLGESFGFAPKRRLSFGPSDRLIEIYRTRYPGGWPDAMELERFERTVSSKYGFTLSSSWHEGLTLGEIFAKTRAA